MKLSINERNAFFALKRLLNLRNISVTATTLKNKLLIEPAFPSPGALSNVLKDFNLFSVVALIKPDLLTRIPTPAIAYFENGMGYVTIDKINNNQVTWYHNELGLYKESIAEFTQKWQGIILVGKSNTSEPERVGEDNFEINLRLENIAKFRKPFINISLAFILGYFIFNNLQVVTNKQATHFCGITFIKIAGLFLSMILIKFNIYGDKCIEDSTSLISKIKNNFVISLNLESRKILGWLTWSEIGLIYFITGLFSLFLINTNNALIFLKWFNIITIPYTLWAIYYQIAVIRKWCYICMGAMALLWLEFYFLTTTPLFLNENTSFPINLFLITILLVTVFWVFVKKHLIRSLTNETLYHSFQRTKFNTEFVKSIFNSNQSFIPIFEDMQTLLVGNHDAENTLFAVLNPNSTVSAIRFNELVSLSNLNTKINCKIILVPDSLNDLIGIKVIRNIFNLPDDQRLSALSKWFKQPNFKKHAFKNDLNESDESSIGLNANTSWVFLARIPLTIPTIFLNKSILSTIYNIKDIPKLLRILKSKY
jgi:hypothetical protein